MFALGAGVQLLAHQLRLNLGLLTIYVVGLHFAQVELLRTQDAARTSNSDPTDEGFCWDFELSHGPQPNQRACSA